MRNIIHSEDDTYNTGNSSEDDSFKSASYVQEENTDLGREEEDNLEDESLGSSSYVEDNADYNEELDTTEEGNPVKKEDNKYEIEDKMSDGVCKQISKDIDNMKDHQIGNFEESNRGLLDGIASKMRAIRVANIDNDFHKIHTEMKVLMNDDYFLDSYRNLRVIYEFILYIFDIYDVPIDQTVPPSDDEILRKTMKKAAGKKT